MLNGLFTVLVAFLFVLASMQLLKTKVLFRYYTVYQSTKKRVLVKQIPGNVVGTKVRSVHVNSVFYMHERQCLRLTVQYNETKILIRFPILFTA